MVPLSEPIRSSPAYRRTQTGGNATKTIKLIVASATALNFVSSPALTQQNLWGAVAKVDEPNGTISIQQTQTGTVGANTGTTGEDFKARDGLLFNALQVGDKVEFSVSETDGAKTITKLQKQ